MGILAVLFVPVFELYRSGAQTQRYTERLRRTATEELFQQYVQRLESDLGTTINQDALARIRGGSAE